MGLLDIPYDVLSVPVSEEVRPDETPVAAAMRIALDKARAAASKLAAALIVGADTIVVLDGAILGKPSTPELAASMLRSLRGRAHQVITSVAVLDVASGGHQVSATTTQVLMRDFSDAEIAGYVASGEPMDKAGAYAVQSESFHPAAVVDGCYLNVVGLPLCAVASIIRDFGLHSPVVPPDLMPSSCPFCLNRVQSRLDTV